MLISGLTNGWRGNAAPAPGSPPPQRAQETPPAQQIQPVPAEEQAVPVQQQPTPDPDAGRDPDAMARAAETSRQAEAQPTPDRPAAIPVDADPAPQTAAPLPVAAPAVAEGQRLDEEAQARSFAESQLQRDRLLGLARAGYAELRDLFRPAVADAPPSPGTALVADRRALVVA